MGKIKLNIDGREVFGEIGKTVLQIAKEAGIYIPTLCYHPSLEPYGGCRLCIVEIKGMKGFPIACATPAQDGMEIKTNTDTLNQLRKETLKLILTEHPNACLICPEKEECKPYMKCIRKAGVTTGCRFCPKDGQCEFQNLVETIGIEDIGLNFRFRNFPLEDEDPFFDRDYNLCVLCDRCVRACNDIRGAGVLTIYYRGSQARVGTAFGKSHIDAGCQFCGACVDVCPTGSLYEKQSRWLGVPNKTEESICVLCSIGCMMNFKVKDERFLSATPSEKGFNQGQACLKGRFLIPYIVNNKKRILHAFIKIHGKHEKVSMDEALNYTAKKLLEKRGKAFSMILSPYLSNEDLYVGQKFARKVMKSNSLDTISSLFLNPLKLINGKRAKEIQDRKYNSFVLVGASPLETSQILRVFLRNKIKEGKKLAIVSSVNVPLAHDAEIFVNVKPGEEGDFISSIIQDSDYGKYSEDSKKLKQMLQSHKPALLIYGYEILKNNSSLKKLMDIKSKDMDLLPIPVEGNTYGTFLLGCAPEIYPGLLQRSEGVKRFSELWNSELPSDKGMGIFEMLRIHKNEGVLYICGEFPYINKVAAEFIIYQGIIHTPLSEIADVILPSASFIETEGTYINLNGIIQKGKKVVEPRGDAKPDWWIFSEIAKRMGEEGFDFENSSMIFKEIQMTGLFPEIDFESLGSEGESITFPVVSEISYAQEEPPVLDENSFHLFLKPFHWSYRDFFMLHEIKDLRRIIRTEEIHMNPEDAKELKITNEDFVSIKGRNGLIKGKVLINDSIPKGYIYAGPDLGLLVAESSKCPVNFILNVKIERG